MALELSLISVGAICLLVLMLLVVISGQRNTRSLKKDKLGESAVLFQYIHTIPADVSVSGLSNYI